MMPSSLSGTWALYPNSTGRSMRPLRIGRASGSCRLTSRVAPSGICPASRDRAWATTVAVRSMVTASSPSARRSRPRIRPVSASGHRAAAVAQHRGGLRSGPSARSARSPVTRPIARLLSSRPSWARARIVAAISRARRPAAVQFAGTWGGRGCPERPHPVSGITLSDAGGQEERAQTRRSARWPRRCRARRLPHRSAHYVATTAGDQGQPAGVPGCRPSMTGTARPGEVWPQRMSGSDERAAIPGSET